MHDNLSDTEVRILSLIYDGIYKPSAIAKSLGITLQGVIYHLKVLRSEDIIDDQNKLTKAGFETLYEGLSRISERISRTLLNLENSKVWEVIADEDAEKGDRSYLYMKNGFLHSSIHATEEARGIYTSRARRGMIAGITNVSGIIKVDTPPVEIIILPDVEELNESNEWNLKLKVRLKNLRDGLIFTIGELAYSVSVLANLNITSAYAAMESAFEASARGVPSIVLVSSRRMRYEFTKLDQLSKKNPEIKVNMTYI
jgi:putative transcriptional regulator